MNHPLQTVQLALGIISGVGALICLFSATIIFNDPEAEGSHNDSLPEKWWLLVVPFLDVIQMSAVILNWKNSQIGRGLIYAALVQGVGSIILFASL